MSVLPAGRFSPAYSPSPAQLLANSADTRTDRRCGKLGRAGSRPARGRGLRPKLVLSGLDEVLANDRSGSVIACVSAIGVICRDNPICPCTSRTRSPGRRCRRSRSSSDPFPLGQRGCGLKRESFVVPELRSAVEPEARNANHGKLDGQHIPFLARRKVSRCAVHGADRRVGKGLRVKPRRLLGVPVVPKANGVLAGFTRSLLLVA
jgi:hypothetical protein